MQDLSISNTIENPDLTTTTSKSNDNSNASNVENANQALSKSIVTCDASNGEKVNKVISKDSSDVLEISSQKESLRKQPTHSKQESSLFKDVLRIREELKSILREDPDSAMTESDVDRILSCGPRYCGPNLLINCVNGK